MNKSTTLKQLSKEKCLNYELTEELYHEDMGAYASTLECDGREQAFCWRTEEGEITVSSLFNYDDILESLTSIEDIESLCCRFVYSTE